MLGLPLLLACGRQRVVSMARMPIVDTELTDRSPSQGAAFLYLSVRDLLTRKINAGELAPGTILKEARISTHLGVSRAPVRRALSMLAEDGLIRSADGQGYIVGLHHPLVRLSTRQLHEILTTRTEEIDRSAISDRIFAQVLEEVTACLPFGTYRIQEAELGAFHDVSRTVAREVLRRLMDHHLIEKSRKSHWIVGQLTARDLRETLEMRYLLEPQALGHVAADLERGWLDALSARVEGMILSFSTCTPAELAGIEHEVFQTMYEGLRNKRLQRSIQRNQISLLVPRCFRSHFPMIDDLPLLKDYAEILRYLRDGRADEAQAVLRHHLLRVEPLTLARLKVLSLLPPPRKVAYLMRVD
jgi:DNA-binding GntR family transcriptional regulator